MRYILAVNAGSSSLKFAVFTADLALVKKGQDLSIGVAEWLRDAGIKARDLAGVGHRMVHGGTKFTAPTLVNDSVLAELHALAAFAPLHMPFGLKVLGELRAHIEHTPHAVCFDTAFHAHQPDNAKRLPLPREYHARGYQRYGFHGLNYEHVVSVLGGKLPRRLLIAHLGNGASMCAVRDGKSVATTMGFSTADGLVMGTRTGSIDPGVLIALLREGQLDADGLEGLIYRRSGMLGVSGISSDMRELLASPEKAAAEAIDYYCYHAARHAGSLIAAMDGIDAIAFTGGIGENSAPIRDRIMGHLKWLNLKDDCIHIVEANEELAIARHVAELVL